MSIDLQNRLVLVTRPQPEGEAFCRLVAAHHGRTLLSPALAIQPPLDPQALKTAVANCAHHDGIIVTSANGARALLMTLSLLGRQPPPSLPPLFAVGKKSAQILRKEGYRVSVPERAGGALELAHAIRHGQPRQGRYLFLQAEQGRPELVTALSQQGCQVDRVAAYRTEPITALPAEVQEALRDGRVDAIPFFSGQTAQAFLNALPGEGRSWLDKPMLVAISPMTEKIVRQQAIVVDGVAREPTSEAILRCLDQLWQKPSPPQGKRQEKVKKGTSP